MCVCLGGRGPGPESGALKPAASRGSGRSRRPQPRALAGITRGTGEARVGGDDDALASLRADWAGDVGGRGLQGGPCGPSAEATPPQPRLSVPTAPRHRLPGRSTQTWTIPGGRGFGHHVNGTKATTAPPAHSSAPRAPLVSSVRSERKAALARFPARGGGASVTRPRGLTSPASRERASPDPFAKSCGVCLGRALGPLPCCTSDGTAQKPDGKHVAFRERPYS